MDGSPRKIRVENLPGVHVARYGETPTLREDVRPFRVLLIKPCQLSRDITYGPPVGILTLISCLRQRFGARVMIDFWDMKLYQREPAALAERLVALEPDVVGVSALNWEAAASYQIADIVKQWRSNAITVIGGPLTHRQAELVLRESTFDWVFEGAADRTFLQALERRFSDQPLGNDIHGFSYRRPDGQFVINNGQDLITDLDSIPLPAWDLVDFDRYRRRDRPGIILNPGERKYAYLFTSRGCPYLCNYCHDTFTKRFVYQSDERVLEEIRVLHEEHGVNEIHFIDDIFNLHRPRVQSIMRAIARRWPGKLQIAFPNGLRGDILDAETIALMVEAGTYHATISVETVTPRLQSLVEKHLDIDKAKWAIEEFHRHGVIVQGAFMLGFPTETPTEIEATVSYAVRSPLTHAYFFAVIPQPATPIYHLAMSESVAATEGLAFAERHDDHYFTQKPWYSRAYGHDLHGIIAHSYARFYFHPPRMLRMLRRYPLRLLVQATWFVVTHNLLSAWRALVRKVRSPGGTDG